MKHGPKVFPDFGKIVRTIATRSVMNPPLWLCGLVTVGAIAGAALVPDLKYYFFWVWTSVVVYCIVVNTFWSFKDPDRLQSEAHREEMSRIRMIGDDINPIDQGKLIEIMPTDNKHLPVSEKGRQSL